MRASAPHDRIVTKGTLVPHDRSVRGGTLAPHGRSVTGVTLVPKDRAVTGVTCCIRAVQMLCWTCTLGIQIFLPLTVLGIGVRAHPLRLQHSLATTRQLCLLPTAVARMRSKREVEDSAQPCSVDAVIQMRCNF